MAEPLTAAGGRFDRRLLLAAAAGGFGSLDTALNVAFPDLVDGLGITIGDLQWVVVSFVLSYGGLLLAAGQWGDTVGHRTVLSIGAALSVGALAGCALATNFAWFLAARVGQGVATAMVMAAAPAMAALATGEGARGRGVGVFQTATGVGAAMGPLIGGPLVVLWGWPAVFWFRVPLCLALLWLARSIEPSPQPTRATADVAGAALVTLGLTTGLLALNSGRRFGPASPVLWGCIVVTAAVGVVYIARSRNHPAPIIRPALLTDRHFAVANLLSVLANGAMFVAWLLVPALLVTELGHPPVVGGLVLAASPLTMGLAAVAAGRWTDRFGHRVPIVAGLTLETVGLAWLASVSASTGLLTVAAALAVIGAGLGLFGVPNMAMVMAALPRNEQGIAGGVSLLSRTAGIVLGVSASAALFDFFSSGRDFFGAHRLTTGTSAAVAAVALLLATADGWARSPARPVAA